MSKEKKRPIRIQVKARLAKPGPPLGSTLAPKGLKVMDVCKELNAKTAHLPEGTPLTVHVHLLKNKGFKLDIKKPLTSFLLKAAVKTEKGSAEPNKKKIGYLNIAQLTEIATQKMSGLNAASVEGAIRILSGTAKSMGIEIRAEG